MSDEESKKPTGIKTLQDDVYGRRKWVIEQAPDEENEEEDGLTVSMKTKNLDPMARKLDLQHRVGKRVVVTKELPKNKQGGFYCDVCDCVLRDSQGYLDHINGRQHNRLLGYNMKVERATVETVKAKLTALKTQKTNEKKVASFEDFEKKFEEDEKKKAINKEFEFNPRKLLKKENEKIEAQLREEKKQQEEAEQVRQKEASKNENPTENTNEGEEEEDGEDEQPQFPGLPMSFGTTKRKK